jgi:hypothetical protein
MAAGRRAVDYLVLPAIAPELPAFGALWNMRPTLA